MLVLFAKGGMSFSEVPPSLRAHAPRRPPGGAIAEDDDRKIGIGTDLEARTLREALVEVAGEEHLLLERGAKRSEPVEEERHPEPQAAEMLRELGRKIGGGGAHPG